MFARLILLALCACTSTTGPFTLAPADGQTGITGRQPLHLRGPVAFPRDQEVPPVIQVIDLESGGFVRGSIDRLDTGLAFVPESPWRADADYLWSVTQTLDDVRLPSVDVPGAPYQSRFSSTRTVRFLNAFQAEGETCVVTSRPLFATDVEAIRVTIDGEESLAFDTLRELVEPDLLPTDRGLGLLCGFVDDVGSIRAIEGAEGRVDVEFEGLQDAVDAVRAGGSR